MSKTELLKNHQMYLFLKKTYFGGTMNLGRGVVEFLTGTKLIGSDISLSAVVASKIEKDVFQNQFKKTYQGGGRNSVKIDSFYLY